MKKLIGGVLTVALLGLLVVLFLGSVNARFELITIKPALWYFGLGIAFLIGGGWLASSEIPGGKFFVGLGVILLALGSIKSIWPSTATAAANAQAVVDNESAKAINLGVAPRQIPCDSTTQPRPRFFDPVTGEPLIWVARDKESGRLECFNRPGFHSVTRVALVAVDARLVLEILAQEPPAQLIPMMRAVEQPASLPSRTPLPELGQGYITDPMIKQPATADPEKK